MIKSWIDLSTNPMTRADQKKSKFWGKVGVAYNRYAPNTVAKRTKKITMPVGTRLLYWYPSGAVVWGRHIEQT